MSFQFLWSIFQKASTLPDTVDAVGDALKNGNTEKYIKSISSYSSKSIFYFPMIIPDTCSTDEIRLISNALENQYATFVAACFSLIPFHKIKDNSVGSIEEYLNLFHQNIGIYSANDISPVGAALKGLDETTIIKKAEDFVKKYYLKDLKESSYIIDRDSSSKLSISGRKYNLNEDISNETPDETLSRMIDAINSIDKSDFDEYGKRMLDNFKKNYERADYREAKKNISSLRKELDKSKKDLEKNKEINTKEIERIKEGNKREIEKLEKLLTQKEEQIKKKEEFNKLGAFNSRNSLFTDTDVKRYNEDAPLIINPTITFLVGEEERPVERTILIGIKAYVHKYSSKTLMEDLYQSVTSKRKFLKFVKFITGEEKSLADLLFGINKIDYDVKSQFKGKNSNLVSMIKRRSRVSKMGVPYLTKTYTPNASFIITQNEVNMLREFYGLDIMKNNTIKTIMEDNFLLAFVIMDQEEEVAYTYYESHDYGAQEISYSALERDKKESDRVMKQLYKDFSIRR